METMVINRVLENAKKKAEEIIGAYENELKNACKGGLTEQAKLMSMFTFFNSIIPANFRKNLSFPDCQILNSFVIAQLRDMLV